MPNPNFGSTTYEMKEIGHLHNLPGPDKLSSVMGNNIIAISKNFYADSVNWYKYGT